MKAPASAPTDSALATALGATSTIWRQLVDELTEEHPGLRPEWKPARTPFGRYCVLRQKARALLYLIPRAGDFEVSVVLGERAVTLALAGDLPTATKQLITEARRYAEGRGIRFPVTAAAQIAVVRKLVASKIAPK